MDNVRENINIENILTIFSKPIDFCCEIDYNSIVRMRKGDKNG